MHVRWQWICLLPIFVVAACHAKVETQPVATHDAGMMVPPDAGEEDAGTVDAGMDAGTPECNFTVRYGLHFPCNRDADCTTGHCAFDISNQNTPGICTTRCSSGSSDCPTGFTCNFAGDDTSFSQFCLADQGTVRPPNDQSLPFGSPCQKSADCAGDGALCGTIPDGFKAYSFCSPPCDKGDQNACNGCGTCDNYFGTHGETCLPKGKGKVGDNCSTRTDCDTFVCAEFCTVVCGGNYPPCPDNAICVKTSPAQSICINPAQRGATKDGEHCLFDFQCPSGDKCLPDNQGDTVCRAISLYGQPCAGTAYCTDGLDCRPMDGKTAICSKDCAEGCGAGTSCVAPDIDTTLKLYLSPSQDLNVPSQSNDDANAGTKWSEMTAYLSASSTVYIAVSANSAFINSGFELYSGGYTLEILDGTHTPIDDVELPESPTNNDTLANAQPLQQVPVRLQGTLDLRANAYAADVDIYAIQVSADGVYTFRTSPGVATACVPSGRSIGDPCGTNYSCTSQQCDPTLQFCTQSCATDADCGGGLHCVATSTSHLCTSDSQYQHTTAGKDCLYDWQCEGGSICAQFGTRHVCAPSCAGDPGSCDPAKTECAIVTDTDATGQTHTTEACVPLGNRASGFEGPCALQSDCEDGLSCTNGTCSKSCMTTADCPAQAPAPSSGTSVACVPCETDADCGAGLCIAGPGFEKFCGDPCDARRPCAAGFKCVESSSYAGTACAPAAGSCHPPTCQMKQCAVPVSAYAEACLGDTDCSTSSCVGSLCTKACQTDADCGCSTGDLTCQSGQCRPAASLVVDAEVGSTGTPRNDSPLNAQKISGTPPWTIYGQLFNTPPSIDQDFFSITLTRNGKLTVKARPLCGVGATGLLSELMLLDSSGNSLMMSTPFEGYPVISDWTLTAGTYLIEMRPGTPNTGRPAAYVLEVSVTP